MNQYSERQQYNKTKIYIIRSQFENKTSLPNHAKLPKHVIRQVNK